MSSLVAKSHGTDEPFSKQKLHDSLVATLIAAHSPKDTATVVATEVTDEFMQWLGQKKHVTSKEIREHVTIMLKNHNHVAAYLYEKHKILS